MQRDDGVQDADGVFGADFGKLVDFVVVSVIGGDRVSFTHAVEDDNQAFVPTGGVVGAGGVRKVMVDVLDALGGKAGEMLIHLGEKFFAREDFFVLLRGSGIEHEGGFVGSIVEAVRDFVNVAGLQAGGLEAIVDRANGEVARVFLAAEAFFGGAGDDLAVDDQDGSGVVALGNAVFALFQAGPVRFLEGN